MIDHLGMRVSDFDASARFYDTLLAPLGISRTATADRIVDHLWIRVADLDAARA